MKKSLWLLILEICMIIALLILFISFLPSYEIKDPSFQWTFVSTDYFKEANITNQTLITNSPRNLVYNANGNTYRFYAETPWTVVVFVNESTNELYSIYKPLKKGFPFFSKQKIIKKITNENR